jgi:hypothetical protein
MLEQNIRIVIVKREKHVPIHSFIVNDRMAEEERFVCVPVLRSSVSCAEGRCGSVSRALSL